MNAQQLVRLTSLVFVASQVTIFAADDLPKPPSFSRYEAMMNKSPFAVATAVAPPPAAPAFAKDMYIANAARLPDEAVVTLNSSSDKNLKEYLSTKGPNKNGYSISNIEWSERVGATKVTVTKDGQFATLAFNQALLQQPVVSGAQAPQQPIVQPQFQPQPVPQQGVPAVPVATPNYGNVNAIKPAPIPTLPTPPPRVRGVIQRGQTGQSLPTPAPVDPQLQIQDQ